MSDEFDNAARALSNAFESKKSYCEPFLSVLPVTGAAISTIGSLIAPETLYATDSAAARLDEVQFDLGEGPCWEALATRRPVLERDVRTTTRGAWPAFVEAISDLPVRGLYAFPLRVGGMSVGVIDLYSDAPGDLKEPQTRGAERLADIAARQVLREVVTRLGEDEENPEPGNEYSRRTIHQATGMVLAQLGASASDAALILRAHAFSTGRTMREVADDVLNRRLDFSAEGIVTEDGL